MKNLLLLALSLLLFSCESEQEKIVNEITEVTEAMKQESFPSSENMDKIVELYDSYIKKFPDAEETYTYMELKAKYLAANNKYNEAIEVYQTLVEKYPDDKRGADALFMQAFILENYVLDKTKAKEIYSDFLKHYPNHELADDAQFSLENMSLSDEDLLEKIKSLNLDNVELTEVN